MVRKRPHHMPSFKITQYIVALVIGLLTVALAPKEKSEIEDKLTWPLSPSKQESLTASQQVGRWWQPQAFSPQGHVASYPWVQYQSVSNASGDSWYYTLTCDDFRCKGEGERAPILLQDEQTKNYLFDCWGNNHGLPWVWLEEASKVSPARRRGKERVYPALIEILNALQKKLHARVVVTCGHRCPAHHRYITRGVGSPYDKHQIAAACDFYIQGLQDKPKIVLNALRQILLAREDKLPKGKKNLLEEKEPNHWLATEVDLTYFQAQEARNLDNAHPYPYFTLCVRYDYEKQESVKFSPQQARALPQE